MLDGKGRLVRPFFFNPRTGFSAATLLLLAATWLAYFPGLGGGFLFDDFNNLNRLGSFGRVDNWNAFLLYVTSGEADPTGRPLSLLTFLIDARNWPADPAPFKRTNVLIHLLNGVLLARVLLTLGRNRGIDERRAITAAVLGTGLWLLHPLLVSTTLYVVQREAMLPATFTLLGLNLWLYGRSSRAPAFWIWFCLASAALGCTVMATLCKGNGVLLPALLLIVDQLFPRVGSGSETEDRRAQLATHLLLWIPSALIALWFVTLIPHDFSVTPMGRSWTVGQRVLSEPRILVDYLRLLWIPKASNAGLFNDGVQVSADALHPWSTLPALAAVAGLATAAIGVRRSHPYLSLAILFYFCGQLLESSVIPLELYFEHRNYLPSMMMFWPLAIWLTGPGPLMRARQVLCVVLPAILFILTASRAATWGRPFDQAALFAHEAKDSARAQVNAATAAAAQGNVDVAIAILHSAADRLPDDPQITLNLIDIECGSRGIGEKEIDSARGAIRGNATEADFLYHWVLDHIPLAQSRTCTGFDLESLQAIQDSIRANTFFSRAAGHQRDLDSVDGQLALARNEPDLALDKFNRAIAERPTPDVALIQAASLGGAGFPELGVGHLRFFATLHPDHSDLHGMPAVHAWILARTGYWDKEISRVGMQLSEDALLKRKQNPSLQSPP